MQNHRQSRLQRAGTPCTRGTDNQQTCPTAGCDRKILKTQPGTALVLTNIDRAWTADFDARAAPCTRGRRLPPPLGPAAAGWGNTGGLRLHGGSLISGALLRQMQLLLRGSPGLSPSCKHTCSQQQRPAAQSASIAPASSRFLLYPLRPPCPAAHARLSMYSGSDSSLLSSSSERGRVRGRPRPRRLRARSCSSRSSPTLYSLSLGSSAGVVATGKNCR